MRGTVTEAYRAAYPDPLEVTAGERLALGKRDAEFPGWIWATNAAGKSGWAPENYLKISHTQGTAVRDYTAAELTVEAGAELELLDFESGWYWAETREGARGWVPASCVRAENRQNHQ